MSFWDWFILIGLIVAVIEALVLLGMYVWWVVSTLAEIRRIDEEIFVERYGREAARRAGIRDE